ncbi:MAG: hypothetical protein C4589_12090 [Peptococcaceae bacterium]|nr:MAG: hypothetical protein C4589_12090 [Peptococcaceae bacterium]
MKECPVCHRSLKEVPKYGVNIDVCSTCRGVWLDRGELEKVVSLARDFQSEHEQVSGRRLEDEYDRQRDDDRYERNRQRDDDYYDKHRHPYKKKKKHGLLDIFGELFD